MTRQWPRRVALRTLRPQLRARIIAAFGLGAFALSAAIATTAYLSARSTIVGQAISSAENSALKSESLIQSQLQNPQQVSQGYLLSIDDPGGVVRSASILYPTESNPNRTILDDLVNFESLNPPVTISRNELPASLVNKTNAGDHVVQIFAAQGETFIGVGIPLTNTAYKTYYVIYPTVSEVHTLNVLLVALIIACAVTTILGAIIGRWAATRALAPLRRASIAASAIASGALDTRIETTDASDLRVLANSFNSMVDALQDRIAREARFTSDVAHELRSPLTTLSTALSVIESRRDELTERSQHALDLLSAEVKRFRFLVTDLLEISRVDAKAESRSESLVEIGPLLANSLENAGAEDVPVIVDPSTVHRWLYVDKRRFERIITNLIENAERYGGGATEVAVVEADPAHVRIRVDDDGPGVDPSDRERIFDRFARGTTTAGSRGLGGGSGLGLALVAEHVKIHDGRVWVESSPSGGARFVVELPFAPAELLDDLPDEIDGYPADPTTAVGGATS
ncbi:MAG TPA: HAMP domain-containing sensor histidine kinase [Acidimicrobiales bacterium]|nr:HAMP domain-containing sensor histidine kinase [Acidimicrobiales bacterium]